MAPEARITAVETRRYRYPLDPPFHAAWDPIPRTHQDATLVLVHSDVGVTGCASGDHLPDREVLERFLVGLDPLRSEAVREICETVDFHGGRPWTVECAVWDLAGRLLDTPVWRLLGGRNERMLAYVSSGELVAPDERARRAVALKQRGVRALKLRFHHADWRDDVAVVEERARRRRRRLRAHGRRQPGLADGGRPRAALGRRDGGRAARASSSALGAYWLEEPLRCDDVEGYRSLRRLTGIRLAAGEMVRGAHEARDLVLRGGVDVLQPDVVLSGGISGCRRLAALADLCGRMFSPHTWSNGYGLVCNLHLTLGVSTCPFVEVPYDPPAWSAERARLAASGRRRDRCRRHHRAAARPRPRRRRPISTRSSSGGSA